MDVVVTGSTGLIGSALVRALAAAGHRPIRLVRGAPAGDEISWEPSLGSIDAASLEGVDAVVHLAGRGHRRPPLDRRLQGGGEAQPHGGHPPARHDARPPDEAAPRARLGVRGRLLRRPRRRGARREQPARDRLPQRGLPGVGGGHRPRGRGRGAGGADPKRRRPQCHGWRAEAPAPAVQARPRRQDGHGSTVAELDLDRRRGRGDAPPARPRPPRPGEPHGTGPGDQRRIHEDPGPGAGPPGVPADPDVRAEAGPRLGAGGEPAVQRAAGGPERARGETATGSGTPPWRSRCGRCSASRRADTRRATSGLSPPGRAHRPPGRCAPPTPPPRTGSTCSASSGCC